MTDSKTRSTTLDQLLVAVAAALTDLGVRRRRQQLIIDGADGDRIVVQPQRSGGHDDTIGFHCNIALCPLPYAAWAREATLEEARSFTYRPGDALIQDRLLTTNGWPPGTWTVTPATLSDVTVQLAAALRAALVDTWLPLLPRSALREALRDRSRALPGPPVDRRTGELMCILPAASGSERAQLATFLEGRGDVELASWIRSNFP